MSSTPGAVPGCRWMTIRGERRKGEVLIMVDGTPLDWRSSGPARLALDAAGILSWLESAAAGTDGVVRLAVEES